MGSEPVSVRAPAKINLYLHVTGRRPDGYHLLDSLVVFTSFGDTLSVEPATVGSGLRLYVDGPFAHQAGPDNDNLVMRAARLLLDAYRPKNSTDATLRLTKRLPVAAGIGGGSSDAAATLRALVDFWKLDVSEDNLMTIGRELGADVPVCLYRQPVSVSGIGETISDIPALPWLSLVLANPGVPLSTPEVFRAYDLPFSNSQPFDAMPESTTEFVKMLAERSNDLTTAAQTLVPEIQDVIEALGKQNGCLLSRMSGSGATCFGLFADSQHASEARKAVQADHGDWWVENMSLF